MRLNHSFLKLPLTFDVERLSTEVAALPASAWLPHPNKFPGNDSVPLVAPGGQAVDDFVGQMAPTDHLRACPYIMGVMSRIGAVWGRSRLMGLGPGAQVPLHVDMHYHWRAHLRIHIPIITNPGVRFTVGEDSVHMAGGECWLFDSFQPHAVQNSGGEKRVHLVLDTVGGEQLWDLIDAAERGVQGAPLETSLHALRLEHIDPDKIMSPWEILSNIAFLKEHTVPSPKSIALFGHLDRFVAGWEALWGEYGASQDQIPAYRELLAGLGRRLAGHGFDSVMLRNRMQTVDAVNRWIFHAALPALPAPAQTPPSGRGPVSHSLTSAVSASAR